MMTADHVTTDHVTADRRIEVIDEIQREVRKALGEWDAADGAKVAACRERLERSAATAARLLEPRGAIPAEKAAHMRARLLELKSDVTLLQRFADSASAFLRSIARSTPGSVMYSADGLGQASYQQTTGAGIQA